MVLAPGGATAQIVRREALSRLLPLASGGTSLTQPIFAADVIDAIEAGLARSELSDRVLDLGGPESLPQREFIERAARLYGRRPRIVPIPRGLLELAAAIAERCLANPPITRSALGVILGSDCIDPEPARQQLGIELTPLDETLKRCVGPHAG